ncbi:MAG: polysaccharide deacetylase [Chloroflexota bacterium]
MYNLYMQWPKPFQAALSLSFDFDAESLWLANGPRHHELPGVLSLGKYGAKVGMPKILELLKAERLTATFFVPGWTAEQYPHLVEAILADGHELGHHGYTHDAPDPIDPEMVEREIDQGLEVFERLFGHRPIGYRPPDGVSSELSLRLLKERGFLYNSSFKDDFLPYRHVLADGSPGPVELPEQPELDDWAFGSVSMREAKVLFPKEAVLSIWKDTFNELYAWGGAATIVMHPQISGRPIRLATLRSFIHYAKTFPNLWITSCSEVAEAFIAQESN